MTQHLLVQAEVTPPVIKATGVNKAVTTDREEAQHFSSELNKQIDKHAKPQEKSQEPVERSNTADTANKQETDLKAEKVDGDDGKNLPKETAEHSEKEEYGQSADVETNTDDSVEPGRVVATTIAPVSVTVNAGDTVELSEENDTTKKVTSQTEAEQQKAITAALVNAETDNKGATAKPTETAPATAKAASSELPLTAKTTILKGNNAGLKNDSEVKTYIKDNVELADEKGAVKKATIDVVTQQKVNSQQSGAALKANNSQQKEVTAETVKSIPQVTTDALSSDQKKQAKALRPDILYGVNKKYSAESAKSDLVGTTEKVMTSERLAAKAINEGQLIADVVKQVKPGLQQATSPTVTSGGLVTAHTPAATVNQGQALGAAPILDIQPAIKTAAWNRVMSGRVVWMAREGVQQAELKLNPAKLGPVEVRLNMSNEQTNVTFIAHHAATREALEQALPRLRESFSENGMELADAEVMQHSSEQRDQDDAAETDESGSMGSQASAESEEFSGEEQPKNDEQDELDVGLSLYA